MSEDETSKKYREQNPYLKEWEDMKKLAEQYRNERLAERNKIIEERIEMRKCNATKDVSEVKGGTNVVKYGSHKKGEVEEAPEKEEEEPDFDGGGEE